MLNYIDFQNPDDTYSGLPNAHCMIYKPPKKSSDVSGVDYICRPRVNWQQYAKVLEAKMKQIFNNKTKPRVQSVVYP